MEGRSPHIASKKVTSHFETRATNKKILKQWYKNIKTQNQILRHYTELIKCEWCFNDFDGAVNYAQHTINCQGKAEIAKAASISTLPRQRVVIFMDLERVIWGKPMLSQTESPNLETLFDENTTNIAAPNAMTQAEIDQGYQSQLSIINENNLAQQQQYDRHMDSQMDRMVQKFNTHIIDFSDIPSMGWNLRQFLNNC